MRWKLRFQFDTCVSAVFSDPRPHHCKGQKGGGTPLRSEKSRGLLCPAGGQSGLLLSFEQIQGLFIIENQTRGAFRAMKEFVILQPTCSAAPSASHPASLSAGSRAPRASEHLGRAGGRLPRSQESQTTLHAHTYPLTRTEHPRMGMASWGGNSTRLTYSRLISVGAYRGWQKWRPAGKAWMGAQACLHPGDHLPPLPRGCPACEHSNLLGL